MTVPTQITPKYVNMPKPGKSYGTVVLQNGNKMVGKAEVLGMMSAGKTYDITTESQDWTNGTVHVVKSATLANGGAHQADQPSQQFKRQPTPEVDAERMFVAGALNAVLPELFKRDNGLTPSKLIDIVDLLRHTWGETFGKKDEPEA